MFSIHPHATEIERILFSISDTLNVDAAVIDHTGTLVASTRRYVQRKGRRVHTPFLQRVFEEGSVFVDHPGHMSPCSGCRFSEHCPATLEFLSCIRLGDTPLGVVTLTSFTKSGRARLAKNPDRYRSALSTLCDWIANIVKQEYPYLDGAREASQSSPFGPGITFGTTHVETSIDTDPASVIQSRAADPLQNLISSSPAMQQLRQIITRVSRSRSSVLIQGETGTGKGLIARAIHAASERRQQPFVTINCASIPEGLFESELFGYEEGAFTGARRRGKPGRFELAQSGTLFLDEIGELPLPLQPKLLHALQEFQIDRVGGTRPIPIDVRIIAATNQNLEELVAAKTFRADLFYRLNVIPIHVPPLRDRKGDIVSIVEDELKHLSALLGKTVEGVNDGALQLLLDYDWPGNVRELQNALEYAMYMEDTSVIQVTSLPERFQHRQILTESARIRDKLQLNEIQAALDKYGYDVKGKRKAAQELGMGLRTLYRRIQTTEIR